MGQLAATRAAVFCIFALSARTGVAQDWWKPYSPPCTERENVFEFTEKPAVKVVGKDRYEITFAVKGYCDVTVAIVDPDPAKELVKGRGIVVRHLASGVLGPNAPLPFQKNSLRQTLYWNGKDDLDLYVKEPEKLVVRVSLGLNPAFDKRLGGVSPHNIPGRICGLAASQEGVFVFSTAHRRRLYIRRFDHDGNYVCSLVPPPANLPEEKLAGMTYIEYEPGKRAVHSAQGVNESVSDHGRYLADSGKGLVDVQPAISGDRIYYLNGGEFAPSTLYYVHTDGSTDLAGTRGRLFSRMSHACPRLAASPDGKWLYMSGDGTGKRSCNPHVLRCSIERQDRPVVFCGKTDVPGSDDRHLNGPAGIDCDAEGRVYVCDSMNNRLQIFAPDGKLLKSIFVDRPLYVCVHKKTGAIYVQHSARIAGRTIRRTTRFTSFDKPVGGTYLDGPFGLMALDSWSAKPRLWFANGETSMAMATLIDTTAEGAKDQDRYDLEIWEDSTDRFVKVLNFDEKAMSDDRENHFGRWSGSALGGKVFCDPVRERVLYKSYGNLLAFDLVEGRYLGRFGFAKTDGTPVHAGVDDMGFDKKGYLHLHLTPSGIAGVVRVNPSQARVGIDRELGKVARYPEVPYDYGIIQGPWSGLIPTKDQAGAKTFQDGFGVNMRGDIAEQCNIYYVPKMEDAGKAIGWAGPEEIRGRGQFVPSSEKSYESFVQEIKEMEKRGESVYFIRRQPGVPLAGGTVWTFDASGELRMELAVNAGDLINGTQIDEDGALYFVNARPRMVHPGGYFLEGKSGVFGAPDDKQNRFSFTGTLIKTLPGQQCTVMLARAVVRMDLPPDRPPDLVQIDFPNAGHSKESWAWVEGAEWLYAGASPIVSTGCSCPTQRLCVDWFKRVFVPESYRHSIGALDTSGNLILHIGSYGNFDSASGPRSRIPVAGCVGMSLVRFVSATDNYLCFEDHGERLVVLKLNYYAEVAVPIDAR